LDTQLTTYEAGVQRTLSDLARGEKITVKQVTDILYFTQYGQSVFSQFDYGLNGFVVRQRHDSVLLTVKLNESGVPLVGYITSHTTTGCIEQMFDLLFAERLRLQKDKYPWI